MARTMPVLLIALILWAAAAIAPAADGSVSANILYGSNATPCFVSHQTVNSAILPPDEPVPSAPTDRIDHRELFLYRVRIITHNGGFFLDDAECLGALPLCRFSSKTRSILRNNPPVNNFLAVLLWLNPRSPPQI